MSRRFERTAAPREEAAVSLQALLPEADVRGCRDLRIHAVACDSRLCRPGDLFVAVRGSTTDGHQHVTDAVRNGAVAVVVEQPQPSLGCPQCVVADSRTAYARLCQALARDPASHLTTIAVTGTNGKTTTTVLVRSVLETAGYPAGLSGTLCAHDGGQRVASSLTTPDAADLAHWLSRCRTNGCSHAVLEASSHALDQRRMAGIGIDVAVVTNVTRDHLDYHGTLEAYRDAKARLFDLLKPGGVAIVNRDDPGSAALGSMTVAPVVSFGIHAAADVTATLVDQDMAGQQFRLRTGNEEVVVRTALLGAHNVSNCLAAASVGIHCGIPLEAIADGIAAVTGVRGRLEPVHRGQPFSVFIDYAHTEDALTRILTTLGALIPGRLICVFGAGGDRDRKKRPAMGRAVQLGADLAVVTSDNPRSEAPLGIIEDILTGMRDPQAAHVEPDRKSAIEWALAQAGPKDCVLIAGKGHETEQIVGRTSHHFDDREVAAEWLERNVPEAMAGQPSGTRNERLGVGP